MPNIDINIKTAADTAGVEKATQSIDKLEKSADKNSDTLKKSGDKSTAAGASMGKMGQLANQASYQVGDFAVQVGAGTSAITAFAQQAPQLLGAFQMAGGLSGPMTMALAAASVAIPIIAFGGRAIANAFGEGKEATDALKESLDKISTSVNKAKLDNLDRMANDMEDSAAAAKLLTQEWPLTQKAQAEFASSALTNLDKLLEAQRLIADAMGLQVNAVKALEDAENRASAKRKLAADQALAAEQKKLAAAQQAETESIAALARKQATLAQHEGALAVEQQALNDARGQKKAAELTLASPIPYTMNQALLSNPDSEYNQAMLRRSEAQRTLADPELESRITKGESQIKTLDADMEALKRGLKGAENSMEKARNLVADTTSAVSVKMAEITQDQTSADLLGKAKLLAATQKQWAADATKISQSILTDNAAVKAGQESLNKVASDGSIIATEQTQTARTLSSLVGQIQVGTAKFKDNTVTLADVVKLIESLTQNQNVTNASVNRLAAQVQTVTSQTQQTAERLSH